MKATSSFPSTEKDAILTAPIVVGRIIAAPPPPAHLHVAPDGTVTKHQSHSAPMYFAIGLTGILGIIFIIIAATVPVPFLYIGAGVELFVCVLVTVMSVKANAAWSYSLTFTPQTGMLDIAGTKLCCLFPHFQSIPIQSIRSLCIRMNPTKPASAVIVADTQQHGHVALGRNPYWCSCTVDDLRQELIFWRNLVEQYGGHCQDLGEQFHLCCPVMV